MTHSHGVLFLSHTCVQNYIRTTLSQTLYKDIHICQDVSFSYSAVLKKIPNTNTNTHMVEVLTWHIPPST